MEKIRINRKKISILTWDVIFDNATSLAFSNVDTLINLAQSHEALRNEAEYNTGSISSSTIWSIFSSCLYFKPKVVAEVGTFIGKSTLALANALDQNSEENSVIYTCDFSNDISLNIQTSTQIHQFPKTSSTEMFKHISNINIKCDLLLLDGRLQDNDFKLIPIILHSNSIIMLDDFEGIEKGTINAMLLMKSLNKSHFLIYPPTNDALERRGFLEHCTLAMIIPKSLFYFTNQ